MRFLRYTLILLIVPVSLLVLLGYTKGFRYPPPQLSPPTAFTDSAGHDSGRIMVDANGAIFVGRQGDRFIFRAFVPEPVLTVHNNADRTWQVEVNNIHPSASLTDAGSDTIEKVDGLRRTVIASHADATFRWRFHKQDDYRFAAIGDTGGGAELRWVLRRAQALGADFILHLGDFYYGPGEYFATIDALNEIDVPTFVAIGNHDFYDGWTSIHHYFRLYIGPRNAMFELGGVRFINLDTAAGFVPADSGARGLFLRNLESSKDGKDTVVFTHKPLTDPDKERDHSISRLEYDYLHEQLGRLGVTTILAGHIHIREDFVDQGIRTMVSGEGLAHADLIVDRPYAKILMGDVSAAERSVRYSWEPIEMPFESHCNSRAWQVLQALEKLETLKELQAICAGEG